MRGKNKEKKLYIEIAMNFHENHGWKPHFRCERKINPERKKIT